MKKSLTQFAAGTTVAPEKTMMEIRTLLGRHGATSIQTIEDPDRVQIAFRLRDRVVRFEIEIPPWESPEFKPRGRERPGDRAALKAAEVRRRWRVTLLIIKSKLEAVASNAKLFDIEMLPYMVMPDGRTIGEHINSERLDQIYQGKTTLLLGPGPQGAK